MVALAWLTTVLTVSPAGVLHLEPQGAELRRLDPGPALAVLADPVLAVPAAERSRGGPNPHLGPSAGLAGPGHLGHVGRLRDS